MKSVSVSIAAALILILLVFQQYPAAQTNVSTAKVQSTYGNYGFATLSSQSLISLAYLNSLTGGDQSISLYEQVIQNQLLASNVREILLDIGWENYTIGHLPFQQWIANWLTACDILGIQNVFYLSQFTQSGVGSNWVMSLIRSYPSTQTSFANGTLADYVSYDNSLVERAVEKDLSVLYSYYGSFSSWVGIGTGTSSDPYYSPGSQMPVMGYTNTSIEKFSNTGYFSADLSNGLHPDNTTDAIYSEFDNIGNVVPLTSGDWITSSPVPVYGSNDVAMMFQIQSPQNSINVQWYGDAAGNPTALSVRIYSYENGTPNMGSKIANASFASGNFTGIPGWQASMQFSANFTSGRYWIVFSCPSCDLSNFYSIELRNQAISEEYADTSSGGSWDSSGSGILWVKSQGGTNLAIYPFQIPFFGVAAQSFDANSSFRINEVLLYLNETNFGISNGTLELVDQTANVILATATLSQSLLHGVSGWFPFQLSNVVTIESGHVYSLNITGGSSGNSWSSLVARLETNPPEGGFQNQSSYMLFRLALLNSSQSHLDYTAVMQTSSDAVAPGNLDAISFTPAENGIVTSVSVLMKNKSASFGNYSSGSLEVSIWNTNINGTPSSALSPSASMPASKIRENGWLNVSGFSLDVRSGTTYWVVLASQSTTFTLAKFSNSYFSQERVSSNGGVNWSMPSNGPGNPALQIGISGKILGDPINNIATVSLRPGTLFSQEFVANSSTQFAGLYVGILSRVQSLQSGDYADISIQLDNGSGGPSGYVIAQGKYYGDNMSSNSLGFVAFSSIANVQEGQRYWIVIQPVKGVYSVSYDQYSNNSSLLNSMESRISTNGGLSWINVTNGFSSFQYMLMSPAKFLPAFGPRQLYNDLVTYHNFPTNEGALRGWNAYVESSRAYLFQNISRLFDSETGKNLTFLAMFEPNILDFVGQNYVTNLYNAQTPPSCSELAQFLSNRAFSQQFLNIGTANVVTGCQGSQFTQELSLMKYLGGTFGSGAGKKVLVVGDATQPDNLTKYLSNLMGVTYLELPVISANANAFGNLSRYSMVVWESRVQGNSAIQSLVDSYIANGGHLLVLQNLQEWTISTGYGGYNQTELTKSQISKFIDQITSHTSFDNLHLTFPANSSVIAQTGNLTVDSNFYGNGSIMLINGGGNITAAPQFSDIVTLISNAILVQTEKSILPIWLDSASGAPINGVSYLLSGSVGNPIFLWLTNPSTSTIDLSLNVNATFFALQPQWSVFDLSNFGLDNGKSSNITLNVRILPQSWLVYYIFPRENYPLVAYSSGDVLSQFSYPNQDLVLTHSLSNQTEVLVVSHNSTVGDILLNDRTKLTQYGSAQSALSSGGGWYYDNQTNLVIIGFVSSGSDSIRILQTNEARPQSVSPVTWILYTLVVLVVLEVGIVAFFRFRKNKRKKNKTELAGSAVFP